MSADDPYQAYQQLAHALYAGQVSEQDLRSATVSLPPLDSNLLAQIAQHAEGFSATKPRLGWALVQVAQCAAESQNADLFLRSLSAWFLARASNHWVQPRRVLAAVTIARRGFTELNDAGWLAACDWQLNALAWTKPNFAEAAQALKDALQRLEQYGFTDFVPDCRLSLAYAQILIGDHPAALENIQLNEETYLAQGDPLNQARCWLIQASSLRRQDHFEEAFHKLEQALSIFESEHAFTDQAKAHYQIALGHLLQADHLPAAIEHFKKAIALAEVTDLDLWRAMSINNLGSVYLINGQLKLAGQHYQEARISFAHHEIQGLLADNLNDSGKLNILMGKSALSLEQFKQCEALNTQLGSKVPAAIAISNLGEAYGQLGRYQDALYHLERAAEQLEPLKIYFRLATCEKYMAVIWSRLGQPQVAHKYLDQAATHYEMADQKALLASTYNYRAATFFQQDQKQPALEALERSLEIAENFGIRPQAALAKRLLGEALLHGAQSEQALKFLEQALSDFEAMGMTMEQAACLISFGTYYQTISAPELAQAALEEALRLSEQTFPEVDWRAYVELGNLAEARGDIEAAIQSYHQGTAAFKQIHRNFLQPALAGSYLQTPARVFDHMVTVSARANSAVDALYFMEETKATTLLRHLSEAGIAVQNSNTQEVEDLKIEIDGLRNQLRTSLDETSTLQTALQSRQTRTQLKQKTEQYDALKNRLERKHLTCEPTGLPSSAFDLDHFRNLAVSTLAEDWVALNYYLTTSELITVIVSPHACQVHSQPISKRITMALAACEQARRHAEPPPPSDLEILGKLLIPDSLADSLTPDTQLLIAPHRNLHQIPWSALQPGFATQPLICICIPCIIPSLQSLTFLWERDLPLQTVERRDGLVVGLSSFQGRHAELPVVKAEIMALSSKLGSGGQVFSEKDATWQNLLNLRNTSERAPTTNNWEQFAWLHIASHFFADRQTGRLSGIAFSDGDVWLDQLRDLTPLPKLVSLSACNGNDSFLYEGDERVDLQTTCLIAGANTVIGSVWPVPDQSAAELMLLFYDHYLSGQTPARAAALAQRQFIEAGKEPKHWASFICAGLP